MKSFRLSRALPFAVPHGILAFLRYSVSGLSSFLIDLSLLYILLTWAHLPYALAVPSAFVSAVTIHYAVCRAWVFRGSPRPLGVGYLYFLAILGTGLTLTLAIVIGLVEVLGVDIYIARIIASVCVGFVSFYLNGRFNFRTLRHFASR